MFVNTHSSKKKSNEEKAEFAGNSIPLHLSEDAMVSSAKEPVAELEIVMNYCLYAEPNIAISVLYDLKIVCKTIYMTGPHNRKLRVDALLHLLSASYCGDQSYKCFYTRFLDHTVC